AQAGADVAINYFTFPDVAEELAAQIRALGRRALLFPLDVSDQPSVEAMVARTALEFGRLDIFVSNAFYSDEALFYEADMAGNKVKKTPPQCQDTQIRLSFCAGMTIPPRSAA